LIDLFNKLTTTFSNYMQKLLLTIRHCFIVILTFVTYFL